jgi:hypothetical protein
VLLLDAGRLVNRTLAPMLLAVNLFVARCLADR